MPDATFFQTPAWLRILTNSFDRLQTGWITMRHGASLEGFMPFAEIGRGPFRTLWSLPLGTYGDPVSADERAAGELLGAFIRMASEWRCLEAGAVLFGTGAPLELPSGLNQRREESRVIELEGSFEHYRSKLLAAKRRQLCNRALEAGVEIRLLDEPERLKEFYGIYESESAEWGGVHPYPFALFEELFAHRDKGVLFLGAYLDDEFLGGHIDFFFGKEAQAWQAGLTERAADYEVSALLVIRAVEEAYRRGMERFNLGCSNGNEGIIFFKESLGGKEHIYSIIETAKRWYRLLRRR